MSEMDIYISLDAIRAGGFETISRMTPENCSLILVYTSNIVLRLWLIGDDNGCFGVARKFFECMLEAVT